MHYFQVALSLIYDDCRALHAFRLRPSAEGKGVGSSSFRRILPSVHKTRHSKRKHDIYIHIYIYIYISVCVEQQK